MGDVEPLSWNAKISQMTPRRGGVGPLTIAVLFQNVLTAAERA